MLNESPAPGAAAVTKLNKKLPLPSSKPRIPNPLEQIQKSFSTCFTPATLDE
jgi:hypothetical protein